MSETLREIGSNVAKLRVLLSETKKDIHRIQTLHQALRETLTDIWTSAEITTFSSSPSLWKEYLSLVASGRVLSVAAQAEEVFREKKGDSVEDSDWLGDGRKHSRWLGRGAVVLAKRRQTNAEALAWRPVAELCGKSFGIGYKDEIVEIAINDLAMSSADDLYRFKMIIGQLPRHEQKQFLASTLNIVGRKSHRPKGQEFLEAIETPEEEVAAAAALLRAVIGANEATLGPELAAWLGKAPSKSIGLYRASIIAVSDGERFQLLADIWGVFSDKLFIKHGPISQQEAAAKILLICAGVVHREKPMRVYMLAHSSVHTSGISERLASSSQRTRTLGMMVGTAISQLVDKPEIQMTFEFEGPELLELQEYKKLTQYRDGLGTISDLGVKKPDTIDDTSLVIRKAPKLVKSSTKSASKITVIESDDEEDDLQPHTKPDSDAEDSDEDATLARRNKAKAPVYILDLMNMLKDHEDHDRHRLALLTAPSLIRRKATFGSELKDRSAELASTYVGLNDSFDMSDFLDLRMKGLVALLVSQPEQLGPWFAATFFSGDRSLGQRIAILTAMGLSARELAGFKEDGNEDKEQYPTKTLPERLHKLYTDESDFDQLATRLEQTMMTPVATKIKPRKKIVKNDLAKLVAGSLFFPLTGRWSGHARSSAPLLPMFLKTLSILLTSAGPSTIALPQMTSEFWDMLLSIRTHALQETATLEALLFGFLTILNVNDDKRRLAQECSKELLETHEWVTLVLERTSGGSEEGERCRGLAAGVLVACKEVVDGWNRLMAGDMVDFNIAV